MTTTGDEPRIRLVIFDWAGTIADHGCFGPVAPFVKVFALKGIEVSVADARKPMGLHKRDHLCAMAEIPGIAAKWRALHDRPFGPIDLDELYEAFIPLQLEENRRGARIIPGLIECAEALRAHGIRIATSTGYFRAAAELVYDAAKEQGFVADCDVCAEDVSAGRPAPWMIFRNMEKLGIYPASAVVKIGDTVPDVGAGLNAGAWSIGVTSTGSEVGLSADELSALPADRRRSLVEKAERTLSEAGAHAVIESIAKTPKLIESLDARLRRGERP